MSSFFKGKRALMKAHPGTHAVQVHLVTPSGGDVKSETHLTEEGARALMALLAHKSDIESIAAWVEREASTLTAADPADRLVGGIMRDTLNAVARGIRSGEWREVSR